MPLKPPTHKLTPGGAECGQQRRPSAAKRGYDRRWKRARAWYLRRHPLCVICELDGRVVVATAVDHIQPHRGDCDRMWNTSNWQALCKRCHDRKTAQERHGFDTT